MTQSEFFLALFECRQNNPNTLCIMKILSLHHIGEAQKTILSVLSFTLITLSQPADAAVVWLVSDDGTNLTMTTTGTLDIGPTTGSSHTANAHKATISSLYSTGTLGSQYRTWGSAYTWTAFSEMNALGDADSSSGGAFGHRVDILHWDLSLGDTPGIITPMTSMTWNNKTISSVFGTSLDAGPVTVWEINATGESISVALVPEPTSISLLALSGLCMLVRRRRY